MATDLRLPTGRPGRILAAGLLLLALAAAWTGLVAPLLAWHDGRAAQLEQRQLLADRMARLAATLPGLQRAAATATAPAATAPALLDGASDAVAAAALQERVQAMAAAAGATLTSTETIPPVPAGAYRQVALRLTLRAPWPALVHLLQSIDQASPRMLVDDLQLHAARLPGITTEQPLDASLAVIAFRAPTPSGPAPAP